LQIEGRVIVDYKSHERANYQLATTLYTHSGAVQPVRQGRSRRYSFDSIDSIGSGRHESSDQVELTDVDKRALNDMRCYRNKTDYVITDFQALLCPARIRGFALKEKLWSFFLVDNVKEIEWCTSAIADVEMDASVKRNLQALVQTHSKHSKQGLLYKKGTGLVILLYGPPGTGKTLTAGE
jgi:hypothetical protein